MPLDIIRKTEELFSEPILHDGPECAGRRNDRPAATFVSWSWLRRIIKQWNRLRRLDPSARDEVFEQVETARGELRYALALGLSPAGWTAEIKAPDLTREEIDRLVPIYCEALLESSWLVFRARGANLIRVFALRKLLDEEAQARARSCLQAARCDPSISPTGEHKIQRLVFYGLVALGVEKQREWRE